jgi:hypothetical protein
MNFAGKHRWASDGGQAARRCRSHASPHPVANPALPLHRGELGQGAHAPVLPAGASWWTGEPGLGAGGPTLPAGEQESSPQGPISHLTRRQVLRRRSRGSRDPRGQITSPSIGRPLWNGLEKRLRVGETGKERGGDGKGRTHRGSQYEREQCGR